VTITTPKIRRATRATVTTEVRLFAREPVGLVWGFALPVIAFVVLACIKSVRRPAADLGGLSFAQVYQSEIILLAAVLLGLVALPPVLGAYRERGVLRRYAVTPMSPVRILGTQMLVHLVLAVATAAVILVVGAGVGVGPGREILGWALAYLLATLALVAIGLLVAALAPNAKVAGGIGGGLLFPMMFSAGLWVPRPSMPHTMRTICDWTPMGAANRGMSTALAGGFPSWVTLIVLAGYAAGFTRLAVRCYRWD
jgi:ABC-2 type transport system permease protein